MKKNLLGVCAVFCFVWITVVQAKAQTYTQTFNNYMNGHLSSYNNSVLVQVGCGNSELYTYTSGYSTSANLQVQSLSKLVTSAVIMTLVEENKFGLDDQVGQYIASWNANGKQNVTIRQLLSHTSGVIAESEYDDRGDLTLQQAVDLIATNTSLMFSPGSDFEYGSCAYKVASRVAEIVESKPWHQIYDERIADVTGMSNSVFSPSRINNPATGRGLECSITEYSNFMKMLLNYGMHNATRVMDSVSVVAMELKSSEDGVPFVTYGLGQWREEVVNGVAKEFYHPGVSGCVEFYNRNKNYYGVVLSQAGFEAVNPINQGFRELVRNTLTGSECASNPGPQCNFNVSASASPASVAPNGSVALTHSCSGTDCSGVAYAWSGNGASGSSSPLNISAPGTTGTYTYTVTASKSGCTNKTANTSVVVQTGNNPCNLTDKQNIGTWNGLQVQGRQFTVNGNAAWLIVTVLSGSTDKHFPRGSNFADRTDISWSSGAKSSTCFGGGSTGWDGLVKPSGITTPSGYTAGTEPDGAQFYELTCTTPSAPSLSASPSSIVAGQNTSVTLSASGCSGGTINWSHSLGSGTSKTVSPTSTTTYTATCTIGGCTSSNGSTTVTVTTGTSINCNTIEGHFDGLSCSWIDGWVYDASNPNTVLNFDIYEGSTLVQGNIPASLFRQDLVDAGKGNGIHGIHIGLPNALKDGQSHTIQLKATGCSFILYNSPRTVSGCTGGSLILDPSVNQNTAVPKVLNVYPNPGKGVFETRFYLEKGKKATIVVTDLAGRQIYRQVITGQGLHNEKINLSGKATGTMILQLIKDNQVEVKKISMVR